MPVATTGFSCRDQDHRRALQSLVKIPDTATIETNGLTVDRCLIPFLVPCDILSLNTRCIGGALPSAFRSADRSFFLGCLSRGTE
jgi:hypothetical protein